jgi:hypothetical protein
LLLKIKESALDVITLKLSLIFKDITESFQKKELNLQITISYSFLCWFIVSIAFWKLLSDSLNLLKLSLISFFLLSASIANSLNVKVSSFASIEEIMLSLQILIHNILVISSSISVFSFERLNFISVLYNKDSHFSYQEDKNKLFHASSFI